MRLTGRVVLLLCASPSKSPDEIEGWLKVRGKHRKLQAFEKSLAAKKIAPYIFSLEAICVSYRGESLEIKPEVSIYLQGASCVRLTVEFRDWKIEDIIRAMRILRVHRREAQLQVGESLENYVETLINQITHGAHAGKIRTQYLVVVVNNPNISVEEHQKEIAGLISWQREWKVLSKEYAERLTKKPVPAKVEGGFVIVGFPSALVCLPEARKDTCNAYLFTIELARVQLHMLKVYSYRLEELAEKVNLVLSSRPHNLSKELWRISELRFEILRAVDDMWKMRNIIQNHRLLWVFDRVVEECGLDRLHRHVVNKLRSIDEVITSCYNLLQTEYSRREQMEIYYLQSIFLVGVIIQALMLLFINITDFTLLGIPLITVSVFTALTLFQLFRKFVSKKMEDNLSDKGGGKHTYHNNKCQQ